MQSFRFRLERVLAWRKTQLEIEESRLKQLTAELAQLERAREDLELARAAARKTLDLCATVDGSELETLARHLRCLREAERTLAARRQQQACRIAGQQEVVVEARRRLRLLERLRARRYNEWRAEADREMEAFSTEMFLARWNRDSGS